MIRLGRTDLQPASNGGRRGSALVFALIVVGMVAALSVGLLRLTSAVTKRQSHAVDDLRAFYLAEAGLSEAYHGLMSGKTGQIGSIEGPALAGDGLVWVDRIENADGTLTLRSTGMIDAGRSTLEIVVRREEKPLGIFADEGIEFKTPFLLDGYDGETSSYYEQGLPAVAPSPGDFVYDNVSVSVVCIVGTFYDYVHKEGDRYYYVDTAPRGDSIPRTIEARAWFDQKHATEPDLGPTTGGGGALGSNGSISLSAGGETVEIYGDVVPGVDGGTSLGTGVLVTGNTEPRAEPLELSPVTVPEVDWLPGFVHSSAIPKVLPPSDIGYESIAVASGSELVVQAGDLVVGDLSLQPDGAMTIENAAGPLNLYVTESAQLAAGSRVWVDSQDPSDLSLQAPDTAAWLDLNATSQFHGMVYAPDSNVAIGSEFEVFGALVANTLELDPFVRLHFDSGVLGDSGAVPLPRFVGWRVTDIPARVAQSRIDPFQLLQLDKSELEPITEAQETSSWMLEVEYYDQNGVRNHYRGPYEQWNSAVVSFYAGQAEFTPPTAALEGEWTIYIRYRDWYGMTREFSGTMTDYVATVKLTKVYEKELTPPPGM